jgi:hypothetical protein
MNPKVDLNATNWHNVKTGYIPKPKEKKKQPASWSLYSKTGQPIVVNTTIAICKARIKAIGKPNNVGLKPIPNY